LKKIKKLDDSIVKKLEQTGFKLIKKINEDKFSFDSPLYISKYKPNIYTLDLYK
jgi:hypothetical protein